VTSVDQVEQRLLNSPGKLGEEWVPPKDPVDLWLTEPTIGGGLSTNARRSQHPVEFQIPAATNLTTPIKYLEQIRSLDPTGGYLLLLAETIEQSGVVGVLGERSKQQIETVIAGHQQKLAGETAVLLVGSKIILATIEEHMHSLIRHFNNPP